MVRIDEQTNGRVYRGIGQLRVVTPRGEVMANSGDLILKFRSQEYVLPEELARHLFGDKIEDELDIIDPLSPTQRMDLSSPTHQGNVPRNIKPILDKHHLTAKDGQVTQEDGQPLTGQRRREIAEGLQKNVVSHRADQVGVPIPEKGHDSDKVADPSGPGMTEEKQNRDGSEAGEQNIGGQIRKPGNPDMKGATSSNAPPKPVMKKDEAPPGAPALSGANRDETKHESKEDEESRRIKETLDHLKTKKEAKEREATSSPGRQENPTNPSTDASGNAAAEAEKNKTGGNFR